MKKSWQAARWRVTLLVAMSLLAMAGLTCFFYLWSVSYQSYVQTECELRDQGVTHWLTKKLDSASSVTLFMKPIEAPPHEVTLDAERRRLLSKAIAESLGGVSGGKGFVGTVSAPQRIKVISTPGLNCDLLLTGDGYRHWLVLKWHDHLYVMDLAQEVQGLVKQLGFPEY